MPSFIEPFPEKGRPESFKVAMLPYQGPNGQILQHGGVFERFWEENANYPDRFDKTLENLGRYHNMYFSYLYVQMCKSYRTMRDDPTCSVGRKWNLPFDREERLLFIDKLPVHAFLPETFPYGDVPNKHLPSKERLAFLGIFMTDDSYHRHAMRLAGRANARGVDMSLAQRQFVNQVNQVQRELGNGNWDAFMTVAAAVSSRKSAKADKAITDEQLRAQVTEFTANADAEAKSTEVKFRDQFDRMRKYKVLKLHKYRMHTHTLLAHFDRKAFTYYVVTSETDIAEKKCIISSDVMGPGVEMVRLNCGLANADQADSVHAVSVAHLGVDLAVKIEHDSTFWMSQACCPACGTIFPAFSVEDDAFNLVKEAGGHGMDFQKSIMFDHENMHVELDRPWNIATDIVEVDLTPSEQQLLAAANYNA